MINKCLLKVAHFAAQLEEYDVAIDSFERVATDSMDNQLTKWSIKEYFLKAGLCSLCIGVSCIIFKSDCGLIYILLPRIL
jgi:alpha-soluble NSF attachment protein